MKIPDSTPLLERTWSTPRLWRYVTFGTVAFMLGGTGTAVAATNSPLLAQIVYNGLIAHVDGLGNLMVNDSAGNSALGTANGHLSNIDTASGATQTAVGTANGHLANLETGQGTTNNDLATSNAHPRQHRRQTRSPACSGLQCGEKW
jgi:hypothetical protein